MRPHAGIVFQGNPYTRIKTYIAANRKNHDSKYIDTTVDYTHIKQFNHYNSWETNKLQQNRKSVIGLNCEAIGIEKHNYDEARCEVNQFKDTNFITINTGAMGAERSIKQTKQWDMKNWQVVVDELLKRGERVIQIGIRWEKKLKHVEHIWQKPLHEVMRYLASSKLHLGNENGLIRLRRLVTNKLSIVLFGPTPPMMYGFENNINIWNNVCHPCFWYAGDWMTKCAMNIDCLCMKSITIDKVLEATNEYCNND